MIGIIAGTKQQADRLAREISLHPAQWFYVWNSHVMRGMPRGKIVFLTGSYRSRPDIEEIEDEIVAGGWQDLFVDLDKLVRG
jgi:hypothetical protein